MTPIDSYGGLESKFEMCEDIVTDRLDHWGNIWKQQQE